MGALAFALVLAAYTVASAAEDFVDVCVTFRYDPAKVGDGVFRDEFRLQRALDNGSLEVWLVADMVDGCEMVGEPRPTPRPTPLKTMSVYSGDADMSFRWLESDEFECSYGDACWGMIWTSARDCDSFYVQLQILDDSDTVVGEAIESTSLMTGQQAKLVFETYEPGAQKARIQDVSCF